MFVRETRRRNADGTEVAYLQLATSFRDGRGRPRTRVLRSLGRADRIDRATLSGLVAALDGQADAARAAAVRHVTVTRSREVGGTWLLDRLWRRVGLHDVLRGAAGATPRLERAAFALVAHHALRPGSKLSVARWLSESAIVPGCGDLGKAATYAALDLLLDASRLTFGAVSDFAGRFAPGYGAPAGTRDVDLVVLDIDARPPARAVLPPAVAVLAVTPAGLPIHCHLLDRPLSQGRVLALARRSLCGWEPRRMIRFRFDGEDLRCASAGVVARDRPDDLHVCRVDGWRHRSPGRPGERIWRLVEMRHSPAAGFGDAYLVRSPAATAVSEVAAACGDLLARVRGWQRAMSGLSLGPVWHYRQDRVRAHAQLVLLSTLLVRIAEALTCDSWQQIVTTLTGLRVLTLTTANGSMDLRTALTPDQEALFAAVRIDPPPQIHDLRLERP